MSSSVKLTKVCFYIIIYRCVPAIQACWEKKGPAILFMEPHFHIKIYIYPCNLTMRVEMGGDGSLSFSSVNGGYVLCSALLPR